MWLMYVSCMYESTGYVIQDGDEDIEDDRYSMFEFFVV